jgi:hypothetical protein
VLAWEYLHFRIDREDKSGIEIGVEEASGVYLLLASGDEIGGGIDEQHV